MLSTLQLGYLWMTLEFLINKHIHSSLDVDLLQQDLNSVIKWAGENNMNLHEDKFEYIVHCHSPNSLILHLPFISELFVYTVSSGRQLRPVREFKDCIFHTLMVSLGEQDGNKSTSYCFLGSQCFQSQ